MMPFCFLSRESLVIVQKSTLSVFVEDNFRIFSYVMGKKVWMSNACVCACVCVCAMLILFVLFWGLIAWKKIWALLPFLASLGHFPYFLFPVFFLLRAHHINVMNARINIQRIRLCLRPPFSTTSLRACNHFRLQWCNILLHKLSLKNWY